MCCALACSFDDCFESHPEFRKWRKRGLLWRVTSFYSYSTNVEELMQCWVWKFGTLWQMDFLWIILGRDFVVIFQADFGVHIRRLQRPSPECLQRCPGVETAYRDILAAQDLEDPKEALDAIHVAMCSNEQAFRCVSGEEDCAEATALGVESGAKLALQVACSCLLPAICVWRWVTWVVQLYAFDFCTLHNNGTCIFICIYIYIIYIYIYYIHMCSIYISVHLLKHTHTQISIYTVYTCNLFTSQIVFYDI